MYHKTHFKKRHALTMIVGAWMIGPVKNLARFVPTTTVTKDGSCLFHQSWPSELWLTVTNIIVYLVDFLLPVCVMLSLYVSVFLFLKHRATTGSLSAGSESQSTTMNKAKHNALKTLFFMTSIFFLCLVWNMTYYFLDNVGVKMSYTGPFYNFTVFMLNINCCVNPFLYAVQYREFQLQAKSLCCKRQAGEASSSVVSVSSVHLSTETGGAV